jgi:hydrophobic/amphiphilic exporter-1 (mainly G- bacteria), HAE1 family
MNLSEPFIKRPVMTTLVMTTIMVFGIVCYKLLPVSALPSVEFPTIEVTVQNPGSNPTTMANTCAVPLEREFMTIDGLQALNSNSLTGQSNIVLQFSLDKNLDEASTDVQAAINRALPNLPKDLPNNPTYQKVNPSETPILYLSITSSTMDQAKLYDYGNTFIGQRISMIDGISQVLTYGAPYAARIQIDPEKIAAMGIGIDEVATAIRKGNVNLPTGTLYGPIDEYTIDVNGQLFDASGYNDLAIKSKDGALIKISQIGHAKNSLQNDKYFLNLITKKESIPSCVIAVLKQPGANTVEVIDQINKLLPVLEKQLPASVKIFRNFDKSVSILESVNEVQMTLIVAFILVVLVIFLSLKKFANTLIPSIALPIAIFGTFFVMYICGFSLDILSLLSLVLCIGFLIDDAIVVLENNVRHVQMGKDAMQASLDGSKEISSTVLSMTLCLVAVFIPLLFLGGVIGRLFREFAITIVAAVLFSGFISLTLTPMLSSRFIPKYKEEKKGKIETWLYNFYEKSLSLVMRHKKTMLSIGVGCIVGSCLLFVCLPKGFLPPNDWGFLQGFTESKDGISPYHMTTYQKEISKIIADDPAVDVICSVSSVSLIGDNEGFLFITLKPYKKRGPINPILQRLLQKTQNTVGINTYIISPPLIDLQTGIISKGLYQYTITGIDDKKVNKFGQIMKAKMMALEGYTQVSSDLQITQPQLELKILRDRASDLNISAEQIEHFLTLAYSGGKISTIDSPINQYDVIIETLPSYYKDPTVLSKLYIRSTTNKLVPLSQIVEVKKSSGPQSVNHLNGLPSVTISFNLQDKSIGDALIELQEVEKQTLTNDVSAQMQGTADVFASSFANLTLLFLLTIFVIYVVLGILYENFIHPITVMSSLPPATFGGLLSLYLFNEVLDIYAFVGIIMLIGIVMKNGIMMVDVASDLAEKEKKSPKDAIIQACLIRFRPILMTSVAAIMGALPIAIGLGSASAQTRRGLGIAVVGGLIFSQILTLILTPVIYYYMEKLREVISNHFAKKKENQTT